MGGGAGRGGKGAGRGDDPVAATSDVAEAGTESQKSYQTILEQEIAAGLHELERAGGSLFMSALSAGLDLGFSVLLMATMWTLVDGVLSRPVVEMLVADMYAVGFIFVVFGRSELFTEHTTLAFLPVLDRRASPLQLARLWGTVYAANLLGISAFSALAAWVAPALGAARRDAFATLAERMVDHSGWVILASAVLAGWMMGLLSWLVTAGRDTVSQVLFVWLVTVSIGFVGLHHSIVGSGELVAGMVAGADLAWSDAGRFLAFATLGNALGGTFFVGVIKYAHAKHGNRAHRFARFDRPGSTPPWPGRRG